MNVLHPRCAGIDVHKETVVVCVRRVDDRGRATEEVRTFATMTSSLLALGDWLATEGVTHAAMESTGVYWKPVWHLLEGRVELLLVNAQHIKQVPGRKTDVKDCVWIAQLLQHGLLKASLVPPRPQQELRELTRQRSQLVGEQGRATQRIQKVLEDANIKLASVATDVMGVSGRLMLRSLIDGETDPAKLADLARQKLRGKIPALREALRGQVTEHHRFLLKLHLEHYDHLEQAIEQLNARIGAQLAPFADARDLVTTIPGIAQRTAEVILVEIGTDVKPFRTSAHLASWAGLCPGNNESAGKRRSGTMRKGSTWLRTAMIQAAWAASRSKDTYLASHFKRVAARRGRKRAVASLAHTLLVIVYHVLSRRQEYQELGADYLDRLDPRRVSHRLVKRLERLGYKVTLETQTPVAV
jgi:transposase